jgi:hypothetical protein
LLLEVLGALGRRAHVLEKKVFKVYRGQNVVIPFGIIIIGITVRVRIEPRALEIVVERPLVWIQRRCH